MSIIKPLKNYRALELKEIPMCVTINFRDNWYLRRHRLTINCSTLDAYEGYRWCEKYRHGFKDKLVFTHINDVKYHEKIYLCVNVFWERCNYSSVAITKAVESQLPPRIHKTCPSLYTDKLCNGPAQCQFIHHYKKLGNIDVPVEFNEKQMIPLAIWTDNDNVMVVKKDEKYHTIYPTKGNNCNSCECDGLCFLHNFLSSFDDYISFLDINPVFLYINSYIQFP